MPSEQDYFSLVNGNLIYEVMEDEKITFGKYSINTKESKVIGTVDNIFLSGPATAIDNTLYEYAVVGGEGDESSNMLYAVDVEADKVSALSSMQSENYIIPVASFGRNLMSLRLYKDHTGVYAFQVDAKTEKQFVLQQKDYSRSTGESMIAFGCDEKSICVLSVDEKGDIGYSINVHDQNGKLVKSISANNLEEDLLSILNREFKVMGDYIYIASMSDKAILGKIVNDKIEVLLEGTGLGLTDTYTKGKYCILYKRYSNLFYLLNMETGKLYQRTLEIAKGKQIYFTMADGENVVVALLGEGDKNNTYYQLDMNEFVKYLER